MFVLLLGTVLAVVVMLGVEVNRIYSEHRALQNQANAAAIAAADATQACGSIGEHGSLVSNAWDAASVSGLSQKGVTLTALPGRLVSGDDHVFQFHRSDISESNAAHVKLTKETQFSRVLPGWFEGNSFNMSAQATAKKEVIATLSAGGKTVQIGNSDGPTGLLDGLLGGILGDDDFTLNPTDPDSLESALVSIGDLLDLLGVSTVAQLVDTPVTKLTQVLLSTVDTAINPAAVGVDRLFDGLGVETLKVGDVLHVVGDAEGAKGANFRLYDLLTNLILDLAAETQKQAGQSGGLLSVPLDIPRLDLGLAKVTTKVGIYVGQAPVIAVGPALQNEEGGWSTSFRSADITVEVLTIVDIGLTELGSSDAAKAFESGLQLLLPVVVHTGGGKGSLTGASCARGISNRVEFQVETEPALASVSLGKFEGDEETPVSLNVKLGPLTPILGGLGLIVDGVGNFLKCIFTGQCDDLKGNIDNAEDNWAALGDNDWVPVLGVGLELDVDSGTTNNCQDMSFDGIDLHKLKQEEQIVAPESCGQGLGEIEISELQLTVLNSKLDKTLKPILDPVKVVLNGLLSGLGQSLGAILNPLLVGLGIPLGGMQVSVIGADQPTVTLVPGKIDVVE